MSKLQQSGEVERDAMFSNREELERDFCQHHPWRTLLVAAAWWLAVVLNLDWLDALGDKLHQRWQEKS